MEYAILIDDKPTRFAKTGKSYRFADNTVAADIDSWDDARLLEKGVYRIVKNIPDIQPWQNRRLDTPIIDGAIVTYNYTVLDTPIGDLKNGKKAELAELRWKAETSGIEVTGLKIHTDAASQAKLNAALSAVTRDSSLTIDWKGEGGWISLDKTAIEVLSDTVSTFVKHCFSLERQHSDAIDALSDVEAVFNYDLTVINWS